MDFSIGASVQEHQKTRKMLRLLADDVDGYSDLDETVYECKKSLNLRLIRQPILKLDVFKVVTFFRKNFK